MGAAEHNWGDSRAADEIWKLVLGIPTADAGESVLVSLVAYIDDSRDPGGGTFVLGGHVASVETWAAFSREWQELLPLCPLLPYGPPQNRQYRREFKMSEMMQNPDRILNIQPFFRLIEKYELTSISAAMRVRDFRMAMARLRIPNVRINWTDLSNPHIFFYRALMDLYHDNRATALGFNNLGESQIDFVFDQQSESAKILASWDGFMAGRRPEVRAIYGQMPVFRDSSRFMPLQAADLWAGWVRRHAFDDSLMPLGMPDFGSWAGNPDCKRIIHHGRWDEDQLVTALKGILRTKMLPGMHIYDVRFSL